MPQVLIPAVFFIPTYANRLSVAGCWYAIVCKIRFLKILEKITVYYKPERAVDIDTALIFYSEGGTVKWQQM